MGPNAAKLGPKPRTMTQNKARRANKIDFLQLPWAQEVWSSNLHAPTNSLRLNLSNPKMRRHYGALKRNPTKSDRFSVVFGISGPQEFGWNQRVNHSIHVAGFRA